MSRRFVVIGHPERPRLCLILLCRPLQRAPLLAGRPLRAGLKTQAPCQGSGYLQRTQLSLKNPEEYQTSPPMVDNCGSCANVSFWQVPAWSVSRYPELLARRLLNMPITVQKKGTR